MKKTTKSIARIPSVNDGHDQAAAEQLLHLFTEAQTGMRRVISLGLFAWELKESKLKHGEFGPWLAAHCPELATPDSVTGRPKPSRSLSVYLELTRGVLENVGFTVEKYLAHISNSQTLRICHGGEYLLLPDKNLPESVLPLKQKICDLVDGKTQRQLFLEFKQSEVDADGRPIAKRGRLKGQGGATVEQREAAQQAHESARLEVIELKAVEISEWLLEVADDRHLGMISALIRADLLTALDTAAGYLRSRSRNNPAAHQDV